ncbi:hypothetical protein [Parapedobacter sp. 2B3]|uniref:hypothetical protein n=1 Tax=Parapedobacter sp. 2B3 TaxID=3342381 RepID=UPI0035B67BF9
MAIGTLKTSLLCSLFCISVFNSKGQQESTTVVMNKQEKKGCSVSCTAKNGSSEMVCKLTSPELRERKESVIWRLKKQMLEKRELRNGYAFRFPGSDRMLDELTEFIKTERECCDFFIFGLSVSGDKREAWLELTGADGVKEFIVTELGL